MHKDLTNTEKLRVVSNVIFDSLQCWNWKSGFLPQS